MAFPFGVSGTAVRARTFRTRQTQDPDGFVRTFGAAVAVGPGPLDVAEADAIEHANPSAPPGCARGKVAAVSDEGDTVCWQIADCRRSARVVGCVNATAAAAALHAHPSRRRRVRLRVRVPGPQSVRVDARVRHDAGGARKAVLQTWSDVPFAVRREERLPDARCAVIVGPFNDYLVVRPDREADAGRYGGAAAMALARTLGSGQEPLLARAAVVVAGDPSPRAAFFTCGGRAHPSAPLTGLAVLALAARLLAWLPFREAEAVRTAAGPMALPRVRLGPDGSASVDFPEVVVDFDRTAAP